MTTNGKTIENKDASDGKTYFEVTRLIFNVLLNKILNVAKPFKTMQLFLNYIETKTTDDIVITHKDTNGGSGGVTVSTGIAPVEHQPNVNVTTDHVEVTSHSKSTPDANTQVIIASILHHLHPFSKVLNLYLFISAFIKSFR